MNIILVKIWLAMLVALDLMLIFQALSRVVLYVTCSARKIDWTCYNKVMLTLLAVTFFPVAAAYFYLRR